MEQISATLAGCQESLLLEAEQFWIENSPLSSVSSSSFEEQPVPQASLPEVFLPYMVMANGQTLFGAVNQRGLKFLAEGHDEKPT